LTNLLELLFPVPLAMVLDLGSRLERAQGRLTRFQINVLVAMCRGAVKLRAYDFRPHIVSVGLSPADDARLRSMFPTPMQSLAEMLPGLMAPPVRLSTPQHWPAPAPTVADGALRLHSRRRGGLACTMLLTIFAACITWSRRTTTVIGERFRRTTCRTSTIRCAAWSTGSRPRKRVSPQSSGHGSP